MKKKTDDIFLAKFGDRAEIIGKDGVMGIMKNTGSSINNNNNIYFQRGLFNGDFNKNLTYKPNRNNSSEQNNFISKNQQILNNNLGSLNNTNESITKKPFYLLSHSFKIKDYNNNINNMYNNRLYDYPLNMNFMDANKNRKSISSNINYRNNREPLIYSCQINNNQNSYLNNNHIYNMNNNIDQNKHEIGNNRQNIIDYGYKPYTLKDYKKINNDIKMGKLGDDNIGNDEWNKKRERMKKMSEYGKQLMFKSNGRLNESSEDNKKHLDVILKKDDEKWKVNNDYLGDFSNNKKYNKNTKEKLWKKDLHLNNEMFNNINENNNILGKNEKQQVNLNYRRRLKNLKNILF